MAEWHFLRFNRVGLLRALARDGRSMSKIAQQAGISYNCMQKLADVMHEQAYIRPVTVEKLCRALDIPREELIL